MNFGNIAFWLFFMLIVAFMIYVIMLKDENDLSKEDAIKVYNEYIDCYCNMISNVSLENMMSGESLDTELLNKSKRCVNSDLTKILSLSDSDRIKLIGNSANTAAKQRETKCLDDLQQKFTNQLVASMGLNQS